MTGSEERFAIEKSIGPFHCGSSDARHDGLEVDCSGVDPGKYDFIDPMRSCIGVETGLSIKFAETRRCLGWASFAATRCRMGFLQMKTYKRLALLAAYAGR